MNKELIQENKWMREKLVALSHELMALSADTEFVLGCSLKFVPDEIEAIRKRLHDMSERLSKDGFE